MKSIKTWAHSLLVIGLAVRFPVVAQVSKPQGTGRCGN